MSFVLEYKYLFRNSHYKPHPLKNSLAEVKNRIIGLPFITKTGWLATHSKKLTCKMSAAFRESSSRRKFLHTMPSYAYVDLSWLVSAGRSFISIVGTGWGRYLPCCLPLTRTVSRLVASASTHLYNPNTTLLHHTPHPIANIGLGVAIAGCIQFDLWSVIIFSWKCVRSLWVYLLEYINK